ncbi:MAG: hypothetical protein QOF86_39, partial [Baekduia sp.]|nr:hypothetical protein [Baekduia sp.]
MVEFLRDAHPIAAVALFLGAAVAAGLLATPRVRSRDGASGRPSSDRAPGAA